MPCKKKSQQTMQSTEQTLINNNPSVCNANFKENICSDVQRLNTSIIQMQRQLDKITSLLDSYKFETPKFNDGVATTTDRISKDTSKPCSSVPSTSPANQNHSGDSTKLLYAEALSSNIETVVKSVVSESIKAQKADDLINSTIIIYGMTESNDDSSKVFKLLQCDKFDDTIIKTIRLGKKSTDSIKTVKTQCRPVKVELKSKCDRDWVLKHAKYLVKSFGNAKISITKCLNSFELDRIKQLRAECAKLNSINPKVKEADGCNKRENFFVFNGRIMERLDDGRMVRHTSNHTSNATIQSSSISANASIERIQTSDCSLSTNPKNLC